MNDQAAKLRSLVNSNKEKKIDNKKAEIFCVASGKGGVGKSNLSLNLAIAIQNSGKSVCIIDADIGLSNIEIIAGVDSKYNIKDVIEGGKSMEDIILNIPGGVKLVSGGSGIDSLSSMSKKENAERALDEIQTLQDRFDYIIIDTGAGIGPNVMNFVRTSDCLIVVSTPDPTSIMDAYVLIKTCSASGCHPKIYYVSNMVKDAKEAEFVYNKLSTSAENFLSIKIENLGYIPRSSLVIDSVWERVPFVISHKNCKAAKNVVEMANYLLYNERHVKKESLSERLFSLFLK